MITDNCVSEKLWIPGPQSATRDSLLLRPEGLDVLMVNSPCSGSGPGWRASPYLCPCRKPNRNKGLAIDSQPPCAAVLVPLACLASEATGPMSPTRTTTQGRRKSERGLQEKQACHVPHRDSLCDLVTRPTCVLPAATGIVPSAPGTALQFAGRTTPAWPAPCC